ncbi:MAG: DNA polymerase IV [Methanothrix harundinacea]|uniref:DNA polymerase IV n=1 Tax=Methanothrix harundinacea TaxID=301375 RepID=A0A101FT29_9EURY|nr:MAG: DNA polymerase IV [Methanothrix harundinacea]KUK95982.1 MAG: DNA polymerase IV [Methanothrix harundinacea]
MRVILHVDLDAFFPAVEVREHPELKGKPVIVGADPKEGTGRGVVSSASYEARKSGVRSAMPISRAWKLCPEGVYLRPHFDLYTKASNNIMQILKSHADKFEQAGIDEAYLDISSRVKDFNEAAEVAKKLMEEVLDKERLTCSVGVAPNKMLAKIGSDFEKLYGLTVIRAEDAKEFLAPLNVRKILGVGPKTEERLQDLNIVTIGDLAATDPELLVRQFGCWGIKLHEYAHGIDRREVIEGYETKSIGREVTFEKDVDDPSKILETLDDLAEEIHTELIDSGFRFKTITVKVRYENFDTYTRAKSLSFLTNDLYILRNNARRLIDAFLRGNKKIRLVGLRVSTLKRGNR